MDCTIDKLAYSGNGVCRIGGKVCFVPFSCPGDRAVVRFMQQKKSYSVAVIDKLLQPSSDRIDPVCPIFGECGGCNWQHIQYRVQLEQKRQIFAETLWRGARVESGLVRDIVASPLIYNYRSRVRFKVAVIAGNIRIGFFRHGSHTVVDAPDGCCVAIPVINEILYGFRSILPACADTRQITEISIDTGEKGAVAIVHCNTQNYTAIRAFLRENVAFVKSCTGLFIQSDKRQVPEKIWGSDEIAYNMTDYTDSKTPLMLSYQPGGFSQINQQQNAAILNEIRRMCTFAENYSLLDLYCGNGNFSLPLATQVKSVLGIEGAEGAIESANLSKLRNGITNAQFYCDDVRKALRDLVKDGRIFNIVLLDPPRAGAADAVYDIVKLQPGKIVYVSCDPSTLARDLGLFAESGYCVQESVPLDMFPHTYHIESITLLIRT